MGMNVYDDGFAPCCFCGAGESSFLYNTPLCVNCAQQSQVAFLREPRQLGIALVHADGRRHWLTWSESDTVSMNASFDEILPIRVARHALIAAGRASDEDPAFMANIGDYVAQVGWTPSAIRALDRARRASETGETISAVEKMLGLDRG